MSLEEKAAPRRRRIVALLALILASLAALSWPSSCPIQVHAKPIVGGYLNPWEVPFRHQHQVSLMRDPMPWEDGYFDPTYHAWPKSRRQQVSDKEAAGKPANSGQA